MTSSDAFTGENFRRGGYLEHSLRYERARSFVEATRVLQDSWVDGDVVADRDTGRFLATERAGEFSYTDQFFDIAGRFNVPRSPQGHPVQFQAGDSDQGREFAAQTAEAIFTRHSTLADGQAFYADLKGRLPRYGRNRDELLVLPGVTFVLGDTDEQARELAHQVRLAQVSGRTAIAFLEQVWNTDLSAYDPDGPLPDIDPLPGELISKGADSAIRSPPPPSGGRSHGRRDCRSVS